MSALIPGKRYRWIVEGVANTTSDGLNVVIDQSGLDVEIDFFDDVGTVKQLPDPLPTTPGSVIRWDDPTDNPHRVVTRTLVRLPYPSPWRDVLLIAVTFTDFEVAGATVLFDAGADQ